MNVESTKLDDYMKIYIDIFSNTLLRKKTPFTRCGIPKAIYRDPVTLYYIGVRCSFFNFCISDQ